MRSWKKMLASALCVCMLGNLSAPAYAGSLDLPMQSQRSGREATASDTDDEDDVFDDEELIDDVNTPSDADEELIDDVNTPSDADEELIDDVNTPSDAELVDDVTEATLSDALELPAPELFAAQNEAGKIDVINNNNGKMIPLHVGDTYELEFAVPEGEEISEVVLSSSNNNIAVTGGGERAQLTGISVGQDYVSGYVVFEDGDTASFDRITFRVLDPSIKIYQVMVYANGGVFEYGNTEMDLYASEGNSVTVTEPYNDEYLFSGWYTQAEGGEKLNIRYGYWPDQDTAIYAHWDDCYILTFDYNGIEYAGNVSQQYKIVSGGQVGYNVAPKFPSDPQQTGGKLFAGWRNETGELLSESDVQYYIPQSNETLTAEWNEDYYTVVFDYGGVQYNKKTSQTFYIMPGQALHNNSVSFPKDPAKTNNKLFMEWRNEAGETVDYLYGYIPAGSETLTAQWSDYYTIVFDFNGYTDYGKDSETVYVACGNNVSNIPYISSDPSQTNGKLFAGWSNEDGIIKNIYNYIPTKSETLTAQWSDYYTVTYDPNGGTMKYHQGTELVAAGEAIQTSPSSYNMEKEGYLFAGWYDPETGKFAERGSYIPDKDVTLFAKWAEYWTITYDANGGEYKYDSYRESTVIKGEAEYLNSDGGYVKDGFKLIGWCEDPACEGKVLTGYYTPDKDVTLYAKWGKYYTITFDAGDGYISGYGSKRTVTVIQGEPVGYLSEPEKTGAYFGGWYTENYEMKINQAYVPTKDETFYAQWITENCHQVTFHAGGPYLYDSASKTYVSTMVRSVGDGEDLGSVSVSRSGYACTWYLEDTFKTPCSSYQIVEKDLELYAKWTKRITVVWDADGGVNTSGKSSGSSTVAVGESLNLPSVTKQGYALEGWYTEDGRQITNQTKIYENTEIKAKWTEGYRVELRLDGGKLPEDQEYKTIMYVKPGELCSSVDNPRKAGAAFRGWFYEDGTKAPNSLSSLRPERDMVLTAKWSSEVVEIRLHGGEYAIRDDFSDKYVSVLTVYLPKGEAVPNSYALPSPTYDSKKYIFDGWGASETAEEPLEDDYIFSRDMDLYPVWKECWNICTQYMGGYYYTNYSTYSRWRVMKGNPMAYPRDNNMHRDGYIFGGWYLSTDYLENEKVTIPFVPDRNMTLYAKWIEGDLEKVRVTFDSQGGTEVDGQLVAIGETLSEPEAPVRAGCIFKGWYKEPECKNRYDFTDFVLRDITLYAGWMETTDLKDASIRTEGTYYYSGEMIIPKLVVMMGSLVLAEGTDYQVSGGGVDAGIAQVTVTGTGTYNGSQTIEFTIEKADLSVDVPAGPFTAQYGQKLKEIPLDEGWQWKANPDRLVGSVGEHRETIVYASPDENHNNKEAQITVTVTPADLKDAVITLEESRVAYNGNAVEPAILSVMLGSSRLQGADYEVVYTDNIAVGTAVVKIIGRNNYTGEAQTTFEIVKGDPSLAIANKVYEVIFGQKLSAAVPALERGWAWQEPDRMTGNATGDGSREFPADFTTYEGCNYDSKTGVMLKVRVLPKEINGTHVVLDVETAPGYAIFTGSQICPKVTVTVDGTALVENTDYTVQYGDNVEVGTGTVTVTGKNNYTGTVIRNFRIIKDPYDIASAEITLNPSKADYTGEAIEPKASVVLANKTLEAGTDYTIAYRNNVDPGVGTAVITGRGEYHGMQEKSFIITPVNYVLKAVYGDLLKEIDLPSGWSWKDGETYVGDVTKVGRPFAAIFTGSSDSREEEFTVIVEPKEITDPTVKIVMDSDHVVYNPDSPAEPEVTLTDLALDRELIRDEDYTVTYTDNENAGKAKVRIEGINNYTGRVQEMSFDIQQAEASPSTKYEPDEVIRITVKDKPFFLYLTYAGEGKAAFRSDNEEVFTVTGKVNDFDEDDIELAPTGIGAGILTIEIPETANYKGASLTYKVEVVPVDLSADCVQLPQTEYSYTGSPIKPEVTVTAGGEILTEGTDYEVVYGENTNAGKGTVTINGTGNYRGSAEVSFTIAKIDNPAPLPQELSAVYGQKLEELALEDGWSWKSPKAYVGNAGISQQEAVIPESENYKEKTALVDIHVSPKALTDDMVWLEYESAEYSGADMEPVVKLIDGTLATEDDFQAVYQNNRQIGRASVTVTGRNNYQGEITKTFEITRAVIHPENIVIPGSYVYDGSRHMPEPEVTVGGMLLAKDTDYTVAYGANIHAGTAAGTVTVEGIGNYTGTAEASFDIAKAENPAEAPEAGKAVYGQKLEEIALTDGWAWKNPAAAVGDAGVQQAEAVLAATADYLEKAALVTINVEARKLTASMITIDRTPQIYDGTAKEPAVTVKAEEKLTEKDYQVSYKSNIHAGTASVIIEGTGNYQGMVTRTFEIQKGEPELESSAGTSITVPKNKGSFALQVHSPEGAELTYVSSNEAVAAVDAEGNVTVKAVGTAVITVTYPETKDYKSGRISVQITVKSSGSGSGGSGSGSSGGSGSSAGSSAGAPSYVASGNWSLLADGNWKFTVNGSPVVSRWVAAFNPYARPEMGQAAFDWFLFDEKGNMRTGWYTDEFGDTYYLNPVSDNTKGRMATGWWLIDGVEYYFNEKSDGKRGRLLKNTTTPDGSIVDENGAKIR